LNDAAETASLRPSSKWHRHLRTQAVRDARLREIAVQFHLRDAFRSGDVWLARSRRYGDPKHALVPAQAVAESGRLKAYSHVSDGRHIREQFADAGGLTDHVFAACAILG
jgi:hypothetical protein